ncbi:unnamed protein product [Parnassius mnemosyne]|uniref:Protein Jumonji n=1 Tax=Parnassius mnemosyne TaxID=213953 RepID=A0AAV1L308_9NEOP
MTRKVQAQRKFAQGAYIPSKVNNNTNSNVSNLTVERKTDLLSPKETTDHKTNNIFRNNSSAKSLLDIVCFLNVHTHMQPIVLLERLQENPSTSLPGILNQVTPLGKPQDILPNHSVLQISKSSPKKHCMKLRSARITNKRVKRLNVRKTNVAKKKINSKKTRNIISAIKRSDATGSYDFNTEDDKPLTYFTRRYKAGNNKKNIKTTRKRKILRAVRTDNIPAVDPAMRLLENEGPCGVNDVNHDATIIEDNIPAVDPAMRLLENEGPCGVNDVNHDATIIEDNIPAVDPAMRLLENEGPCGVNDVNHDATIIEDAADAMKSEEILPETTPSYEQDNIPAADPVMSPLIKVCDENYAASLWKDEPVAMSIDEVVKSSEVFVGLQRVDSPLPRDDPIMSVDEPDIKNSVLSQDDSTAPSVDGPVTPAVTSFKTQCEELQLPRDDPTTPSVAEPVISAVTSLRSQREESPSSDDDLIALRLDEPLISALTSLRSQREESPPSDANEVSLELPTGQGGNGDIEIVEDSVDWISTEGEQNVDNTGINNALKRKQVANRFKVPQPPKRKQSSRLQTVAGRQRNSNKSEISSTSASQCISSRFNTFSDILNCLPKVLNNRCKACVYCTVVDRALQICKITKLLNIDTSVPLQTEDSYEFSADSHSNSFQGTSYINTRKGRSRQAFRNQSVNTGNMESANMPSQCPPSLPRPQSKDQLPSPRRPLPFKSLYLDYSEKSNNIIEFKLSWQEHKKKFTVSANKIPRSPDIVITKLNSATDSNIFYSILGQMDKLPLNTLVRSLSNAIEQTSHSVINNDDGAIPSTSRGPNPEPVVTVQTSNNFDTRDRGGHQAEKPKAAFPRHNSKAQQVDAPIFYPTEAQFTDPIAYFNEIKPTAAKFGLCKIVAPETFKSQCVLKDEMRFGVTNQYISRFYTRWGPASREMCAMKAYLATQSVVFTRSPLLDGIEVSLPKLYELVQRCGGLKKVIEKKRWSRVAEEMQLTKSPNIEKKLDLIYVKYILPYDTLSNKERLEMMKVVEVYWNKKNKRMLDRALNPLHSQKRILGESESSEEEDVDDLNVTGAFFGFDDCILPGRHMNLATFKKVANKVMKTYFTTPNPTTQEVENAYWKFVLLSKDHVCINTASIDTGVKGYGFTKNHRDIIGKHPWNLKVLSGNAGNALRYLGSVMGVTVPTLHLGMVFSTSCWHRDPHGLPWIEYMHSGPAKIWYGIPDEQSTNFRRAVELLCPTLCQNKSIWLSSDLVMIPPNLLLEHNVSLSRVEQKPGEFILVFPNAYSCSISTGYTVSESVYFATNPWLKTIHQVFQELKESCEPTMFALEHFLLAAARDPRSPLSILPEIYSSLSIIIREELDNRAAIMRFNVPIKYSNKSRHCKPSRKRPARAWNVREQDECEICRATLYLSRVRGLPSKKKNVCLQHGRRLLENSRQSEREASIEMDVFVSEQELDNVLQGVQNRLVG